MPTPLRSVSGPLSRLGRVTKAESMKPIINKCAIAVTLVLVLAAAWFVLPPARNESAPPSAPQQASTTPLQPLLVATQASRSVGREYADSREMVGPKAFNIRFTQADSTGIALDFVRSRLAASAAGDAQATYAIFQRVSACRREVVAADEGVFRAYSEAGMGAQYANSVERSLEQCASLFEDSSVMSGGWLALAAEQGSVEARIVFARLPEEVAGTYQDVLRDPARLVEYRKNAVRYLNEAASQGSLDALVTLGNIYERGLLAERDDVRSYAYKVALGQVRPTAVTLDELARLRRGLSSSQQAQAEMLSREILRDCCSH